ncbi:MAG: ABC transporter substrate-binding protein, partial [Anaerolineales bacterium]
MKRSRSVLLLLAAFALVLAACGGGETPEAAPAEPIKIGELHDMTKTFTPWGVQVRDGMALAAKEINEAGGVNGCMIEI